MNLVTRALYYLSLGMWAGRLEVVPVLVLLGHMTLDCPLTISIFDRTPSSREITVVLFAQVV